MNYKYCIFDIDGTIETTGIRSLISTVRDLMGREMTYEEAYPYFGVPSEKVGGMLGYPDESRFWHEWEERFIALRHLIVPFGGMLELIAEVKKNGAVTGFVTWNSTRNPPSLPGTSTTSSVQGTHLAPSLLRTLS